MKAYLQNNFDEMLSLLERLVNIDSGSHNIDGVNSVGAILKTEYEKIGFSVEVLKEENYGNHLIVKQAAAKRPQIILIAHMDTVFSLGTAAERPFTVVGEKAYGPGVIDMKASQVSLLYALKALKEVGYEAYKNVLIILNSDEEVGSPTSKNIIKQYSSGKQFALVMEPARKDGSLVSSRRGSGRYVLSVRGKAAHSGIAPQSGVSAIEELARKVVNLHDLSNHDQGISVNVGVIEGGESVNMVAPTASARFELRINTLRQANKLDKKIREICAHSELEGTELQLEGGIHRLPMEKNIKTKKLLEQINEVADRLGIRLMDVATGGGSDASFPFSLGIATIDGMGPIGGNAHEEGEYLEVPSLIERCHLLAEVIASLSGKLD